MEKTYDIQSILNAIEDINIKPKETNSPPLLKRESRSVKKNLPNDNLLAITEKIILEAEEHSNKLKKKLLTPVNVSENILILDTEYNNETLDFEGIKKSIIEDLYSSFSNKIKKNTLKTIFDLHKKIKNLENKIKVLSSDEIDHSFSLNSNLDIEENNENLITPQNKEHLINHENKEHLINHENKEHLINHENKEHLINDHDSSSLTTKEDNDHYINENDGDLSESVIKTLRLQESLIKNFKENEEKFRLKIVDLEQDISLLGNKQMVNNKQTSDDFTKELKNNFAKEFEEMNILNNLVLEKKKSESNFYKENYERLIIDNNDVKKKLSNAKKQIIVFEKNIYELEEAFKNLSNVLSKNSVVKLGVSPFKASLESKPSNKPFLKSAPLPTTILDEEKD